MTTKRSDLEAVLADIEQSPDRSTLFYWLVENHEELAAASRGRRLHWTSLATRFRVLKLTDRDGKPASKETARKTWRRARAYVARLQGAAAKQREAEAYERATGTAAPSRPPSRTPLGWQPQPVDPVAAPVGSQPVRHPGQPMNEASLGKGGGQPAPDAPSPGISRHAATGNAQSPTIPIVPDLPKEGGPLTPEQVRAMKARLQRTLDERSGR